MNRLLEFTNLIFKEDPTPKDVMAIILVLGTLWGLVFTLTIRWLSNYLTKQPWFRGVSDSDYERIAKDMLQKIGIHETKEEYYDRFSFGWPWIWCVCLQHLVGGILCIPAILGLGDESTASSLACLGILSEVSWEISDMLMWLHKRYFTKNGRHKAPGPILAVLFIQHSLSCFLGIPMILRYRHLRALHWLCFELQAAAAMSFTVQQITKLLDVSDRRQYRLFLQLTGLSLVTMIVTRLLHWPILVGQIMSVWYEEQAWGFLAVGVPVTMLFSFFSLAFCVVPCATRLRKFWNMTPVVVHSSSNNNHTVCDSTSSRPQRRPASSSAAIKAAAASLVLEEFDPPTRRRSSFVKNLHASFGGMDSVLKVD